VGGSPRHVRRFHLGRAIFAFLIVGAIAAPLLYQLGITVAPARTPDGHVLMPIGQVFFAIAAATVIGGVGGYLFGRRGR
jgi:hypothetical protein